jgi:hypothetical protein
LAVGWRWKQQPAKVFHAVFTIAKVPTLDVLPHIEGRFFSYLTRRHSGYHRYLHATRSHYTHTQHALAIVGSHGHLPNRLRLHHQDGVGRGLCAITGRCQNEDLAAGQRDCKRIGTFYTATLLTRLSRCPLFPRPPPSPPYSITMSTSPTVLTTKKERRCDTCAAWLSSARHQTAYSSSLTSCESPNMENTTSVRRTLPQHHFVAGRISD